MIVCCVYVCAQESIELRGASATVETWAVGLGATVLLCGLLMYLPPEPGGATKQQQPGASLYPAAFSTHPRNVVRQPFFRWCYLAMMLIAMTGLVVTAQLKPIASHYGAHLCSSPMLLPPR
jgi:hypothetical protein